MFFFNFLTNFWTIYKCSELNYLEKYNTLKGTISEFLGFFLAFLLSI
jgi:hypothetical protein